MKPYVEINTRQRIAAKTEFERNFFKLMVNSIYGKSLENVRKRKNIEIVNNAKRRNKVVRSDNFKNVNQISELHKGRVDVLTFRIAGTSTDISSNITGTNIVYAHGGNANIQTTPKGYGDGADYDAITDKNGENGVVILKINTTLPRTHL